MCVCVCVSLSCLLCHCRVCVTLVIIGFSCVCVYVSPVVSVVLVPNRDWGTLVCSKERKFKSGIWRRRHKTRHRHRRSHRRLTSTRKMEVSSRKRASVLPPTAHSPTASVAPSRIHLLRLCPLLLRSCSCTKDEAILLLVTTRRMQMLSFLEIRKFGQSSLWPLDSFLHKNDAILLLPTLT